MSTATAMVRPPPPPGPPPQHRPNARPPPPKGVKPPPPPRAPSHDSHSTLKRKSGRQESAPVARKVPRDGSTRRGPSSKGEEVSIIRPVVLRDVTVFQKKHQVGQGTYGSVFMGADKDTGEIVALKRINTEQEENGFPITAIREVKILKALTHDNIVKLKEIVTSKEQDEIPKNVFMVFEYLEYDLTGILETPEIRLTQDHIKSWANQLLQGCHFMHVNKIVHRDLKASNLLVNKKGELKIADWGLARSWNPDMMRLTNRVITLWYRPPELLLGCEKYSPKIDMWSVGCIIAEMFRRSGFLKGSDEASQLDLIFKTCGHPNTQEWPDIHKMCPLWKNFAPRGGEAPLKSRLSHELRQKLPHPGWMTKNSMNLIKSLLTHNPEKRICAKEALAAEYFYENPLVKPASRLSMKLGVDTVHEWEARKKHEQRRLQAQQAARSVNGNDPRPAPPNRPRPLC